MNLLKEIFIVRNLKKDLLIVVLLVVLPFAFFIYKFVPATQVWRNAWFDFDSGYYENVNLFVWTLMLKMLTLILLSIWFLTCKHSWRYVLFVPVIAEIYKVFVWFKVLELDYEHIPAIYNSLIFSIPYLLVLLLFSNLLGYYKHSKKKYSNELNNEINNHLVKLSNFDTKKFKSVKREMIILINKKNNMTKKEYLVELIALRDRITI